jgi:dCMP deaminase
VPVLKVEEAPRLSWDELWLGIADLVAKRSLCVRAQVGAVIVDRDNRIIATGYNGPPQGFDHGGQLCDRWCERGAKNVEITALDRDYTDCVALHAEANAISVCDRSLRERGTIYVMGTPCFSCAKLIANSGLAAVVIGPDRLGTATDVAHRSPRTTIEFLESCDVDVIMA